MGNLMLRNIIADKGLEGMESFLVVDLTSQGEEKFDNKKVVNTKEVLTSFMNLSMRHFVQHLSVTLNLR